MSPTYLRRLERKSPPEVVAAYREGKLSVRSVQALLRLSPRRQLSFLRDPQAVVEQHTERCRRVTETINDYLHDHTVVDLEKVREILAAAVTSGTTTASASIKEDLLLLKATQRLTTDRWL